MEIDGPYNPLLLLVVLSNSCRVRLLCAKHHRTLKEVAWRAQRSKDSWRTFQAVWKVTSNSSLCWMLLLQHDSSITDDRDLIHPLSTLEVCRLLRTADLFDRFRTEGQWFRSPPVQFSRRWSECARVELRFQVSHSVGLISTGGVGSFLSWCIFLISCILRSSANFHWSSDSASTDSKESGHTRRYEDWSERPACGQGFAKKACARHSGYDSRWFIIGCAVQEI